MQTPIKYLLCVLLIQAISKLPLLSFADPLSPPDQMDTLVLMLPDRQAAAGDTLLIEFRVRNFKEVVGLQFDFRFDTAAMFLFDLGLGDFGPLGLSSFGLTGAETGSIRFSWADFTDQYYSMEDDQLLFTLKMKARRQIGSLAGLVFISEDILTAEYIDKALQVGPVRLQVDLISATSQHPAAELWLGPCSPNPFRGRTTIPFRIPASGRISLRIHDSRGRLIRQQEGLFPAGAGRFEVAVPVRGLLFYTLQTPWGLRVGKMVSRE